ncbi:MAG: FtsX-like permease family protein [Acidobacteriota bacterium]
MTRSTQVLFVLRMAWRETRTSWGRLVFFFLCVGLGVASIVVLRSVVQEVRRTLTREARALIAADVIVQSNREASGASAARLADVLASPDVAGSTEVVETQTMAAAPDGHGNGAVKLVELRGVEAEFPYYGQLELEGGQAYSHRLLEGHGALVQPELLIALDLSVGDSLRLAGQTFRIAGAIARDRIQRQGIALGPRVYIDLADLKTTSLLGFGGRATYQQLLRVPDPKRTAAVSDRLRAAVKGEPMRVRSWQTMEDRIGENLTTAENYLSLVGFAVVVLGGLGVWSVTRVIVQQKVRSVAVLRCLGASGPSALAISLLQVLALAAGGCVLGLAMASAVLAAIPARVLEPLGVTSVSTTWSAAWQGVAVGLLVSLLFALVPLLEIRNVKPLFLLRPHSAPTARQRDWRSAMAGLATGLALALVAMWQANSIRGGAYVSVAFALIAGVLYVSSVLLVRVTRPLVHASSVAVRHATINLARPGNQTRVILMSVGLGCFFIVGVRAMQTLLVEELTTQVGRSSPDFVLIDIQRDQIEGIRKTVEPYLRAPIRITPLVRGRVTAVAGTRLQLANPDAVREQRGLGREFGLTFRNDLESNERITAGTFWSSPLTSAPEGVDTEVSVEQQLHDETGLSVGDVVQFDLAGIPLQARVTSIRRVAWDEAQNGGFVFVLRPAPAVDRAAQNYVGFIQVRDDPRGRGTLQRDLVRVAPNVSVIDVRDVIASIRDVVANVTLAVTVVGIVTLVGGVLILVGAVAMTKFQRVYEAAIYRTLGASTRLVATMLATEYGLLGLLAGVLGSSGGILLSWVLCRYLFHIEWHLTPGLLAGGVVLTALTVSLIGVLASLDVLVRKPMASLRNEL